jgi:cytochrome P450
MEKHSPFASIVSKTHGSVGVSMAPLLTKDHRRQRRALGSGFSTQALLQQQDIIQLHVRKLIVQMQRLTRASEQIDMTNWCKWFRLKAAALPNKTRMPVD